MKRLAAWMRPVGQGVLTGVCLAGYALAYAGGLVVVLAIWLAWNVGSLASRSWCWACERSGVGIEKGKENER
jgi:hypothetical protein